MGLPTFTKTWQYSLNNTYAAGGSHVPRDALYAIKNILCGFAQNPWSVVDSNGRTTVGVPSPANDVWNEAPPDNWIASTSLVWANAGTLHSWIVLYQAALGMYMLWDLDLGASADYAMSCYVSPTLFTGGTLTDRPTSADECEITTTNAFSQTLNNTQIRAHVFMSTDGTCTRIFLVTNSIAHCFWILDELRNPRPALARTWVAGLHNISSATQLFTYASLSGGVLSSIGGPVHVWGPQGPVRAVLSTDSAGVQSGKTVSFGELLTVADDIDGSFYLTEMGVFSNTPGGVGVYGALHDLWFGSTGVASADDYDDTGNKTLGQIGVVVLPSNGETLGLL